MQHVGLGFVEKLPLRPSDDFDIYQKQEAALLGERTKNTRPPVKSELVVGAIVEVTGTVVAGGDGGPGFVQGLRL